MSITLSDGMYASSGLTVSPQLLSGSIEFAPGEYLELSPVSTQFNLVGDFTIEAWIYPTGIPSAFGIFQAGPDNSIGPWALYIANYPSFPVIAFKANGYFDYLGTNAVPYNVWSHVAVVRSGGVLTYYLNGIVDTVFSSFGTAPLIPSSATAFVGTTEGIFNTIGNISNLRIVVGVAVYTSAFTPSSSPLTVTQPANFNGNPSSFIYSGATVLLLNTTNNDFNFLDGSDNHFSLTGPNMPTTSALSPFFGSLLFNGTSDFLTIPSGVPTTSATWTIEFWIYSTDNSTQQSFVSTAPPGLNFWKYPGTGQLILDDGAYGQPPIDAYISVNTWTHLAIVRNGDIGATAVYKDGILVGSSVGPYGPLNNTLYIGNYAGSQFYYTGYMSNFRYVSGVAVYTSNFIPSSNQLTSVQGTNVNGSPSSAISDSQTKLLLNTQYNNGAYLLDSSSNHYNVLGPNMPVPSSSSPFEISGSVSFDGSTNYLTTTNFNFSTNNFTIEGWFFPQALYDGLNFWGQDGGSSYNPKLIAYISGVSLVIDVNGYGIFSAPTSNINVNAWNHIAFVRSGLGANQCIWYINGVNSGSGQIATNLSNITSPFNIGYIGEPGLPLFFGSISNFRIVNGIAVYTSDFVPATNPLTSTQLANINGSPSAAITGTETSLLLNTINNNTYILDSSSNQVDVLGPNMPNPSLNNPFDTTNGSFLFNGTSDYLIVNDTPNAAFGFGTGDFTVEAWINLNEYNIGGISQIIGGHNSGSGADWLFGIPTAGQLTFYGTNGAAYITSTSVIPLDTWIHVAFSMISGTGTIYINGVASGSGNLNGPYGPSLDNYIPITIGDDATANPNAIFNGYISNLRVVKGIAVYTSNFTPSTTPLTSTQLANVNGNPSAAISGTETSLLLNTLYNYNTYLEDTSSYQFNVLGPNMPVPDASTPVTGGGSSLFDGTNDFLKVNNTPNTAFAFGSGDFTIECWAYYNSFNANFDQIIGSHIAYVAADWIFGTAYGGTLAFYTPDTNWQYSTAGALSTDTWYHLAFSVESGIGTFYIDGIASGTVSLGAIVDNYIIAIGADITGSGATVLNGYISNLRVVKGIAVYTTDFTPSTTPLTATQSADVNGYPSAAITGTETSLLLNTPNSMLNRIDSSSYNFFVTSPNTPLTNFNTFLSTPDGSSSFNGTSDYLSVPAATGIGNPLDLGTGQGDWTVECWFNGNNLSPGGYGKQPLISYGWIENVTNPSYGIYIYLGQLCFNISDGGGSYAATALPNVISNNVWYHTALVRQGGSAYCFLNGVLAYTLDISFFNQGGYNGFDFAIGTQSPQTPYGFFDGYISNVRVVKGIAVYTSNFTPSTTPLTSTQLADVNGNPSAAISGTETSLLLPSPNNNYNVIDTSSYNWLISSPNNPTTNLVAPNFLIDGSMLFNGNTSFLTIASATELGFGTGDYTIEFWVNFTSIPDIVSFYNTYYGNFFFQYNPAGAFQTGIAGYAVVTSFGFTPVTNTWYHVAVTRSSSTTQCWVNGTEIGTPQTDSVDYGQTGATVGGGGPGSQVLNGYLSNFRVVKGLAVYTTDFIPPSGPLTSIQSANVNGNPSAAITGTETSLLLNTFNSSNNRLDSSSYNFLVTSPNTPVPDDLNPLLISEGSMLFNGISQYLTIPDNAAFIFTGDFTMEAWIYPTSFAGTNNNVIIAQWPGISATNCAWQFQITSTGKVGFVYGIGETNTLVEGTSLSCSLNVWSHVAVTRVGSTIRFFVNGVADANTPTVSGSLNDSTSEINVGRINASDLGYFTGYISNLRLVNGTAVYTQNFIPPTSNLTTTQLTNQNGLPSAAIFGTETSLLLNTPNNVLNIFDSSSYRLQVTSPGNPTPVINNPF